MAIGKQCQEKIRIITPSPMVQLTKTQGEFTETQWQNTFTAFFYSREKRRTLSYKSEFQRKQADETYQANQNVNVEQRKEWNEC